MNQQNSKIQILKVGMIPFWNLLPLRHELVRNRNLSVETKMGPPTMVNKWLQEGSIHLAPSSSICLNQPGFEMALPLGIASTGEVKSVYLGLQAEHLPYLELLQERIETLKVLFKEYQEGSDFNARKISQDIGNEIKKFASIPLNSCPSIKFSSSSASSVALTKILYVFWFGYDAFKFMASRNFAKLSSDQKPIELVIGDEALIRQNNFVKTLDLGQVWKDITDLPFVFAVWQSKGLCLNGWRRKILELGELAEKKMRVEPADYLPALQPTSDDGKTISLIDYWRTIRYRLGPEDFRGLLLFLCLARKFSDQPLDHEIAVKLSRWQEVSQNSHSFHL